MDSLNQEQGIQRVKNLTELLISTINIVEFESKRDGIRFAQHLRRNILVWSVKLGENPFDFHRATVVFTDVPAAYPDRPWHGRVEVPPASSLHATTRAKHEGCSVVSQSVL